jgi:hypothetical protein
MLLNARRIYRGDIGTNLILLAMENVQWYRRLSF